MDVLKKINWLIWGKILASLHGAYCKLIFYLNIVMHFKHWGFQGYTLVVMCGPNWLRYFWFISYNTDRFDYDVTTLKDSTSVCYICYESKPLKSLIKQNLGTDEALRHVSPHVGFGRAYGCECSALCGPCQCEPLVPWCSFWPGVCVRQEHLQNDDLEEEKRREEEGWDVFKKKKKMAEHVFELHTPLNG